jgi:hypothetical protein
VWRCGLPTLPGFKSLRPAAAAALHSWGSAGAGVDRLLGELDIGGIVVDIVNKER